ncbi:type IV secretory system conjugative DNA transfer family protein [Solidesulfovibrio carbinolicus]|uniref:type IV secretory system conjugative DNA transfer family protein n=1 Tax=Solidesulfovibrio carbinolicus TaxID=296842 RepID=UPI0010125CEB|nr:type IV secretory system conjugative DNA transfer family protein [Solidesulfovibrio carbinolicus]
MAPIGFCAKAPVQVKIEPAEDAIVRFDSGISISEPEACYNTLILGSTGTGKTTSVILPAVGNLIERGHGGIIIDIKGNLTDQVRVLAKKRGRIDDIIELGSGANALRVDLLNNLTITQVRELLTIIATFQFGTSSMNLDWHAKGINIATEIIVLLRYIHEKHDEIKPNLRALVDLLNNWPLAARMFEFYKKNSFNKDNKEEKDFVNRVTSDNFNPMVYDTKRSGNNTYNEQTTWRLTAIRNGLTEFLQNDSIVQNFATNGFGLDIVDWIYGQKKILVLKFDGTSGQVGPWLSRYVLSAYYKAVFENGLKLGEGEYTFFIGDEFQELCDFYPGNRYNDNAFAAKSREYRNISIVSTQSVSSLQSRGASGAAVMEFLNNINNRLFFYCDDPVSHEIVRRYNQAIFLNELDPGKTFVVKFDDKTRRHLQYVETMQESHDLLKKELADEAPVVVKKNMKEQDDTSSLEMIFEIMERRDKDNQEKIKTVEVPQVPGRISHRYRFNEDDYEEHEEEQKKVIPLNMRDTVEKFPHFFQTARKNGRVSIQVPNGWIGALENALTAFERTGLEIDICNLHVGNEGGLCLGMSNSASVSILDVFLEVTAHLCPICGNALQTKAKVCGKCMEEFEIFSPGK